MALRTAQDPSSRWWQRRAPSVAVLFSLLGLMAVVALVQGLALADEVPKVTADEQGEDPWTDPVGIEKAGEFLVVHVPQCAAGPIVRVALWDENSNPYWEVTGPPTPMTNLVVGMVPEGFTETVPFTAPPRGAVQRLVVVRSLRGLAGVRFTTADLRTNQVASGLPLSRYSKEGYATAAVCGGEEVASTTSTTAAG